MQKYEDLIMGLISGIVLIFLNSDLVYRTLRGIFHFFIHNRDRIIHLDYYVSLIACILSFIGIGICITITYSFLILKKVIIKK